MKAGGAAASATDSVVYSRPAAKASGSVWFSTVVSACCRWLIVVDVANALSPPRIARTRPMDRMRPGVVATNHQRGWAGSVGDSEPSGSVDGCANSTVTSARTSSFGRACHKLYKQILRVSSPDAGTRRSIGRERPLILERVRGDGDGWVVSDTGMYYWGRHGAAGLLLRGAPPPGTPPGFLQPPGRRG